MMCNGEEKFILVFKVGLGYINQGKLLLSCKYSNTFKIQQHLIYYTLTTSRIDVNKSKPTKEKIVSLCF